MDSLNIQEIQSLSLLTNSLPSLSPSSPSSLSNSSNNNNRINSNKRHYIKRRSKQKLQENIPRRTNRDSSLYVRMMNNFQRQRSNNVQAGMFKNIIHIMVFVVIIFLVCIFFTAITVRYLTIHEQQQLLTKNCSTTASTNVVTSMNSSTGVIKSARIIHNSTTIEIRNFNNNNVAINSNNIASLATNFSSSLSSNNINLESFYDNITIINNNNNNNNNNKKNKTFKPQQSLSIKDKQNFVKNMAKKAWEKYHKYFWGQYGVFSLKVIDEKIDVFGYKSGYTLITSMSTLAIMGLNEEFENGRKWIEFEWSLDSFFKNSLIHELVSGYIGSLLSTYSLTNDQMFLQSAIKMATAISKAYQTETGE